jgi:hypothetical protein
MVGSIDESVAPQIDFGVFNTNHLGKSKEKQSEICTGN